MLGSLRETTKTKVIPFITDGQKFVIMLKGMKIKQASLLKIITKLVLFILISLIIISCTVYMRVCKFMQIFSAYTQYVNIANTHTHTHTHIIDLGTTTHTHLS